MRVLLEPRWIVGHVLFVVFATAFLLLGAWQLRRDAEASDRTRRLESRLAEAEVDLAVLDAIPPDERAFRHVTATGTYDPSSEAVLVGRSLRGEPGHHLLTPLRLADGTAVLVDRGWVPFELNDPPVHRAAPPGGEVAVRGILLPPFERVAATEGRPERVRHVDTLKLSAGLTYPLRNHYLLLQEQDPSRELPVPAEAPDPTDNPPHLSYAVQWFGLAAVSVIGYTALLRKEVRGRRDGTSSSGGPPRPAGPPGDRRTT